MGQSWHLQETEAEELDLAHRLQSEKLNTPDTKHYSSKLPHDRDPWRRKTLRFRQQRLGSLV
jgi:hypothetical protein